MTLEQRVVCTACGSANLGAQTRCLICQAPLVREPLPPPAVAPRARFCINCGAPRSEGRFCINCGTPFAQ